MSPSSPAPITSSVRSLNNTTSMRVVAEVIMSLIAPSAGTHKNKMVSEVLRKHVTARIVGAVPGSPGMSSTHVNVVDATFNVYEVVPSLRASLHVD